MRIIFHSHIIYWGRGKLFRILGAGLVASAIWVSASASVLAGSEAEGFADPKMVIEHLSREALAVINMGGAEGRDYENRARAFLGILNSVFDVNRITVASIGRSHWKSWTQEQRVQYRAVFVDYMTAIYLERFSDYSGSGFDIVRSEVNGKRALVRTRLEVPDEENVVVAFLLRRGKHGWKIVDVYFDGAISEVAGLRAQFSKALDRKGWDGLIREMKELRDRLVRSSARGSDR